MNGAELIVKKLIMHGVDIVFGYPGANVLPLYDSLYKNRKLIKVIRNADEAGAAHAADGYARASGKTGVCIATSGPGATNLVTAIATAQMDSVPMIFITGNVPLSEIGTDSFQEADITGITMPVCKYNWMVTDINRLPEILEKAFMLADSGRKGPVVIDIPKDIFETKCSKKAVDYIPDENNTSECRAKKHPDDFLYHLDHVAEIINASKKPFVIAGGGVRLSKASKELIEFCEKLNAPVGCTLMALGEIPFSHPLFAGNLGNISSGNARALLNEADTIISIGARFTGRSVDAIGNDKKIIHIDLDRAEINKKVKTDDYLWGDAAEVLGMLTPRINRRTKNSLVARKENEKEQDDFSPKKIIEALYGEFGDDAYIVTDVGLHQVYTSAHYPFNKPGHLITSGGFGTMGFGLGAAVGTKLARPENEVVLVTGDGSFMMNMSELSTVAEYNIPITVVILDNKSLGMVRDIQSASYNKHFISTGFRKRTDFAKAAKAFGIRGFKIKSEESLKKILTDNKGKSKVLHCIAEF